MYFQKSDVNSLFVSNYIFFSYTSLFFCKTMGFSRNHDILKKTSFSSRISKNMRIRSICPNHHPYRKCSEYACFSIFVKKRKFFSEGRDFSKNPMCCRKTMKYMKKICNSKQTIRLHRFFGNQYFGPLREKTSYLRRATASNFLERAKICISKNPM